MAAPGSSGGGLPPRSTVPAVRRRAPFVAPHSHPATSSSLNANLPRRQEQPSPGGGGRMPSPGGGGSGFPPRLPNDQPPLGPRAATLTESHAATWDAGRSATSAPPRPPNGPPPFGPRALSFTEPHAATWDAGRTTTSAEVYEVAGDDFSPNHWTPDYSQPRASSSQYFSNLMTQDDLEFLNPPDATPSIGGKGASKRGGNYSDLEDIQLCKSWIHISNDPIIGNGQPTKTYWERIGNDFHSNRDFESDRTPNSLEHCFAIILKECMKFQGYYEEVERRHPSGIPYQEHLLEAHARYARKAKGKN